MGKKKTKKHRGSRTYGGGTQKNRRGAGNRGGRGKAGADKHHYTQDPKRFGKHGFKRPQAVVSETATINVGELDELASQLLERGVAEETSEGIKINAGDLEVDKVLGSGKVTRELVITAPSFSSSAKRKIENAGGQAITRE